MEKIKCKICEAEIYAKAIGKNHYIATDTTSTILAEITTKHYYDAFDCPVCKCQNILGERKNRIISVVSENVIPDEVTFVEKEKQPECYGYFDKESTTCAKCNFILSCEKQTVDDINEEINEEYDKILGDKKENKTLCDKCNKQDKECSCDCTREFVEKEERRNKLKENEPKCFGNYDNEDIICIVYNKSGVCENKLKEVVKNE